MRENNIMYTDQVLHVYMVSVRNILMIRNFATIN